MTGFRPFGFRPSVFLRISAFGLRISFEFRISAFGFTPSAFGFPRIAAVRPQREQEEERAQHILALGHPGHRFHVERVKREKRGHERAAPDGPRQAPEQAKEEDCVGDMKQEVDDVRGSRAGAEQLRVQHVGNPGHRVPVARVAGGEGPGRSREG